VENKFGDMILKMKTLPKHIIIRDELISRINGNRFPDGALPTEEKFAEEFKVNRHTVRKALKFLKEENYISRTPGKGSFILDANNPDTRKKELTINFRFQVNRGTFINPFFQRKVDYFQRKGEDFSKSHPSIKIRIEPVPASNAAIAWHVPELYRGRTPTIISVNYLANDAIQGKLLPLDDFKDLTDTAVLIDGRLFRRLKGASGELKHYAIPIHMASWMMTVNLKLIGNMGLNESDIPSTWNDFLEISKKIYKLGHAKGIYPFDMEFFSYPMSMTRYLPYIYSVGNGKDIVDKLGEIQIDNQSWCDFLRWMKSLYPYKAPPDIPHDELNSRTVFKFSIDTGLFVNNNKDTDAIKPVPFPTRSLNDRPCGVINYGCVGLAAGTFKNSAEKEAAWLFIKYLLSRDFQLDMYKEQKMLPIRSDLYPEIHMENPKLAMLYDYGMKYGLPAFDLPRNGEVHEIIRNLFVKTISGISDMEESVNEAKMLLRSNTNESFREEFYEHI
jgi:ABC-type glycerol-3-phosphate transport system substrate-binding protein